MAIDPELIYIEILETVLTATLDPDLWKSALQKLALLTGHQYAAFPARGEGLYRLSRCISGYRSRRKNIDRVTGRANISGPGIFRR